MADDDRLLLPTITLPGESPPPPIPTLIQTTTNAEERVNTMDLIADILGRMSRQLRTILSPYDLVHFSEAAFKALFIATLATTLEFRSLTGRYTIQSEISPDNTGTSYVDLSLIDTLNGVQYLFEFKYTRLEYIKDLISFQPKRSIYDENIYPPTAKEEKSGRIARQFAKQVIHQWDETWNKDAGVFTKVPDGPSSPLVKYGVYDFEMRKNRSLWSAYFVEPKADDEQVLSYTLKALTISTTKMVHKVQPLLVRGIVNRIFYFVYDYKPTARSSTDNNPTRFAGKDYYYVQ